MKASLKDIATDLHLSKATISWILSGQGKKKGFSDETIKRVQEYAEKIGYRTNKLARSLSKGSTQIIGLIVPCLSDTFYAHLADAVEQEAAKFHYSMIVSSSNAGGEEECELIDNMRSMQVDGIILASNKFSPKGVVSMLDDKYPFVLVDRYYSNLDTNFVLVNNEGACYDMVHEMYKKGAKKIAFITSDHYLLVMQQRMEGYRKGLKSCGLVSNESLEVLVDRATYKEDIITKLDKLFSENKDIDGLFFSTHYLAMESIRYCINHHIDYHKLVLGCFHNTDGLDVLAPHMMTTSIPVQRMGEEGVRILLDHIKDEHNELPFEKVIIENEKRV